MATKITVKINILDRKAFIASGSAIKDKMFTEHS
jgi:hypothetical protein